MGFVGGMAACHTIAFTFHRHSVRKRAGADSSTVLTPSEYVLIRPRLFAVTWSQIPSLTVLDRLPLRLQPKCALAFGGRLDVA